MDPRALDRRPTEDQLRDWEPSPKPPAPTLYKCTRCGHESHTATTA